VWLDRPAGGARVASCELPRTGGLDSWQTIRCSLRATGTHDVYLQVRGGGSGGEVVRLAALRFASLCIHHLRDRSRPVATTRLIPSRFDE
jgi:hypothetical protein